MKTRDQLKRQWTILRLDVAIMQLDGQITYERAKEMHKRIEKAFVNVWMNL